MPAVSIVTPVYNAGRWLPETLACVQAQTFTDWEHIFVDDGSTDQSRELIENTAAIDGRIRLLRSPRTKGGPSAARNVALDHAQGRFIAFLDADDLWLPEKLARAVEWITRHGYSFIYNDYRHISYDGSCEGALIEAPEILDLRTLHVRRGHGGCCSMVIDRQRVGEFRFPQNHGMLHEDFCAWLSLVQAGHIGHRLPVDLSRNRLYKTSRSANKIRGVIDSWKIYREKSMLSVPRASIWFAQYIWNCYWMHRRAKPRSVDRIGLGRHDRKHIEGADKLRGLSSPL